MTRGGLFPVISAAGERVPHCAHGLVGTPQVPASPFFLGVVEEVEK